MIHWITPDFPLSYTGNGTFRLNMKPVIFDMIEQRNLTPQRFAFSDLLMRDLDVDVQSDRYLSADTSFPGIVLQTPKGLRLIDGRHRVKKQICGGQKEGEFYVIPEFDVRYFLERVNT